MDKTEIFISHSKQDKDLADAFFELLVVGIGVRGESIFCSSVEGVGVEQGKYFVEYIRGKIIQSKLIVPLLSPNYLASMFCICELGAAWALDKSIFPIAVPPLTRGELKSVLTGIQQGAINIDADLADLRDTIIEKLALKNSRTASWEARRNKFKEELPSILSRLPKPVQVDSIKYQELEIRYLDSIKQVQEYQDQLKQRDETIEEIKKCKDRGEITKAILKKSGEQETFQILLKDAKQALSKLPAMVQRVLAFRFVGRGFKPDSPDQWEKVMDQVDRKYLVADGPNVLVNEDHPKVSDAIKVVDELKEFLKSKASYDLVESYEKEHGYHPEIDNKEFWEDNLLAW